MWGVFVLSEGKYGLEEKPVFDQSSGTIGAAEGARRGGYRKYPSTSLTPHSKNPHIAAVFFVPKKDSSILLVRRILM